ncbi:assimilatory sulfite reductase [Neolentinus lepideus HHB14362 ss-1]|uniref:assimilatory sulfite reductase (NADPH) n=1 Tax=Neolentinus lepideus HHB14362 ss-1 TaxID=1314782 RepID=A0A165PAW3_9AGAM|nr:assimilatory sulfite reductase [Neolentinus lepideus HHB14362 ss-1]
MSVSGISTPVSATSTLRGTSPSGLKNADLEHVLKLKTSSIPASNIIESIASRASSSSTVFIYDLAEQVGFGTLTKSWAGVSSETANVVSLQTRSGAGLSLVGRLSQGLGSSKDVARLGTLTAYTTPSGLSPMAQALLCLPKPSANGRLVVQVPAVTPTGESFTFSPTLAPLAPALSLLPESFAVLLSATPQESVDLAALSYKLQSSHVIHIFDHHSSAREIGSATAPNVQLEAKAEVSVREALKEAGYDFFDYAGDNKAHTVVVLLNGPLALAAKALASQIPGLGVVTVRVLRPWSEESLREVIPSSVKKVHVLDDVPTETSQGSLFVDVFSALLEPTSRGPSVHAHRVTPAKLEHFLSRPSSFAAVLSGFVPGNAQVLTLNTPGTKKLLFFSSPGSALQALPQTVEDTFITSRTITARRLTDHDAFSKPGGISADRIILSKDGEQPFLPIPVLLPINSEGAGEADFVAVLDQTLLKSHEVLNNARRGSEVLVVTTWSPAELASNLAPDVAAVVAERQLRLCTIDARQLSADLVSKEGQARSDVENVISYLAFLRLYLGKTANEQVVRKVARAVVGDVVHGLDLAEISGRVWDALIEIDLASHDSAAESSKGTVLRLFSFNAIAVETDEGDTVVNGARLGSWHDAAKHIIFPSAFTPQNEVSSGLYAQNPALRPEIPDRTFLATCTVNKRLTPKEYDRNVFHLEFDTSGTGLTYAIGEALGVHGWNDEEEVVDFCRWYGVDPNRLITIPVPNIDGKMHTRTVFQALQQQIDLFGKPPKSFYTDLSEYAAAKTDKMALQFIGSPEGSSTFKKLSEKDTVTFADVLRMYPSARPGIEVLCELIGDIKPRHYSIASSQAVVGDRVDLLVVSVEWVTPSGSPRYGQCTRYLAGLRPGQKVTVSIKPSVMKLPPDNMQPLIMAGLGTGAAPFRAFLQYRAWLASQKLPIGPIYYYFGSRHQSQEYLYGEEIEAFILDKTITKAGLAFSRDGPKKVYIQHKMLEDAEDLARMLYQESGVFYLCGPTWPVPDVYEALVDALVKYNGMDAKGAGDFLEGLKEEERYVLEVY